MEVNELLRTSKRESAVDIVVNSIKQLLIEKKLKPGDRLPNELEISEAMNVSRGSVREAMKILSAFGLVDIRIGNGTYVCETPGDSLMDSMLFSFFVSNPDLENLYEFRHFFEIDVLEMILKHYDENKNERTAMENNLNALKSMMQNGISPQELKNNDLDFHRLMGRCTKNPLMERVYNFVIDFMEPSITASHKNQKGEIVYKVHSSIMDVIKTRDYSRINQVITDSVDTWSVLQPDN